MGKRTPVPTPAGHQQCHQCLAMKPVGDFEPCRHRACGITSTCRPCLAALREDREGLRQVIAESVARMEARERAPTIVPDYQPPLSPIPEAQRKTDEYVRQLDARIRQARLGRRNNRRYDG